MSTTLLYQMYNIRGYRQRSMKCVAGGMEIAIEQPRERIVCPNCGSDQIILKGKTTRRFLAVPTKNSVRLILQRFTPFGKTGASRQCSRLLRSGRIHIWGFCIWLGRIWWPFDVVASLQYDCRFTDGRSN